MENQVLKTLKDIMDKDLQNFEKSLSKVRTGRASLSLLDGIKVDYYGTATPLNQLASLSVPESRTIQISPWDASVIGAIEKAIQKSELGLMPTSDGKIVRISIPQLTEQRRKELVKVVKKMAEECKVKLRNERRDANERFKAMKKDNKLSEDDVFKNQGEVQKLTDEYIKKADVILATKEKEIMEI